MSIRDSGIGDFGEEGIATFLRDHRCNNICKLLKLNTEIPLVVARKTKGKGRASDGTHSRGVEPEIDNSGIHGKNGAGSDEEDELYED